jgi:OmpA-OmpF porin, OOP family
MSRHLLKLFLSFFFAFLSIVLFGQTSNKKAKKLYAEGVKMIDSRQEKMVYTGLDLLKSATKLDSNYADAWLKMGQTYLLWNMHNKHQEDIKLSFLQVDRVNPTGQNLENVYYTLTEIFLEEGSYALAKKYAEKFKAKPATNKKLEKSIAYLAPRIDFGLEAIKNTLPFDPVKLPEATVNRYAFNSHPVLTADQQTMLISVRNSMGNLDENIVVSKRENEQWTMSQSISNQINTPKNEGMATISGDGRTLVFTSCYREDAVGGCDLYISYKTGEEWSSPKNLGNQINSRAKDSEPSLSADGRTIYFSSDRLPGYGLDIYKTVLSDQGKWQKAQNLGAVINTKFNEVTPFLHADGIHLYFASDGHLGLGGYDNFVSELKDTLFSIPRNLGYPLNTSSNEGSIYISPDYQTGYFELYDKKLKESRSLIYTFAFPEQIRAQFTVNYLKGKVLDALTKKPIKANIELTDIATGKRNQFVTSDSLNGNYLVVLPQGSDYALHIQKYGYLFYSANLDLRSEKVPSSLDIYLKPIQKGQNLVLNNLFYEVDKFQLTPKSRTELLKLVDLLTTNTTLKLEISGHTDNLGVEAYNQKLSLNRAAEVYRFLVENGINTTRLKYLGLGSKKPISDNSTNTGRQLNRRIEIVVL